jgi:hypothetical protein
VTEDAVRSETVSVNPGRFRLPFTRAKKAPRERGLTRRKTPEWLVGSSWRLRRRRCPRSAPSCAILSARVGEVLFAADRLLCPEVLHPVVVDCAHLHGRPCATPSRRNTARCQCPRNAPKRFDAAVLNFADYRQHVSRISVRSLRVGQGGSGRPWPRSSPAWPCGSQVGLPGRSSGHPRC